MEINEEKLIVNCSDMPVSDLTLIINDFIDNCYDNLPYYFGSIEYLTHTYHDDERVFYSVKAQLNSDGYVYLYIGRGCHSNILTYIKKHMEGTKNEGEN